MGFDVIGAAVGAQGALGEQLRRHLLQVESQQRQQQIDQQGENIALNREYQRMNAESLADSRRSQAELRQSQIDERNQKLARQTQMMDWAKGVIESNPTGQVADGDWQSAFSLARAKNILATGEDLPDSVQASVIGSYMKNPNDKMLTPQEYAQQVELAGAKADATNKSAQRYPRPSRAAGAQTGPGSATDIRQRKLQAMQSSNNFLSWLMQDSGGDVQLALKRFDANPDVTLRKAGGDPALVLQMRRVLEGRYRSPEQQLGDRTFRSILDGTAQLEQDDEDQ